MNSEKTSKVYFLKTVETKVSKGAEIRNRYNQVLVLRIRYV